MTMQFNAMKGYYVRTQDNPPITVDWSTTIQSLSTDLQGYDVSLELTANSDSFKDFFNNGGVFKAEIPLYNIEYYIAWAWARGDNFARGATFLINILAGQTTLDKAADLVRGLGETHKQKADYLKKAETKTYHDRTILKNGFNITETRHSFSVGDVHQLARMLPLTNKGSSDIKNTRVNSIFQSLQRRLESSAVRTKALDTSLRWYDGITCKT